jgi:hypothetical protein
VHQGSVVFFLVTVKAASVVRRYHSRAQAEDARVNLQAGFPRVMKIQYYFYFVCRALPLSRRATKEKFIRPLIEPLPKRTRV